MRYCSIYYYSINRCHAVIFHYFESRHEAKQSITDEGKWMSKREEEVGSQEDDVEIWMLEWRTYAFYVPLIAIFEARMVPDVIKNEILRHDQHIKESSLIPHFVPFNGRRCKDGWYHSIKKVHVVVFHHRGPWYKVN